MLKKNGWTLRKKTVSQKIPNNWVEIARADSARICELMKVAGVEVLINSDEMFVQFYPADDRVVAPKGAHRVGSNIEEDTKVGCTLMVGMECFSSTLLDPFVVMVAKHEGTLMKNWSSYAGPAKVVFQPNHWMKQVNEVFISMDNDTR